MNFCCISPIRACPRTYTPSVKWSVLVVEDDDTFARMLEIALPSISGVRVSVLPDGGQALKLFHDTPSDVAVLITRLNMPHMSGFELITHIRAGNRYTTLPILVMIADSDPETPARIRRLGVPEDLRKPCSPVDTHRKFRMLLRIS